MLDLSKRSSIKYILFGSLYFSEGLTVALTSVILVLYFSEKDISIATITLVAGIGSIPWMMKFIFGPTIDYYGRFGRKIFILIGGIIGILSFAIIAFVDPATSIGLFTVLFFIGHSGVVFLDVSADAWAIQIAKSHERGKINSSMHSGLFGGTAIGGILFTAIATWYGFELVFLTTSVLIAASILFTFTIKETKIEIPRNIIKPTLIKEFSKRNTQIICVFVFVSAMNFGMLRFVIPEYMTNVLMLDKIQIGLLTAIYPLSIVIGTLPGGILADIWGRKKVIYITLTGLLIASALLITADTWEILAIIYASIGFLTGAGLYSAMAALLMDITNPKIGGAQYSFLASIANLGAIGVSIFSGSALIFLGYSRYFLYTALIVGVSILLLYFVTETYTKTCKVLLPQSD